MLRILSSKTALTARAARGLPILAAAAAALTAWLSQGLFAYAGSGSARIGLLPVSAWAFAVSVAVGGIIFAAVRRGFSAAPLCLLGLVVLPWMPVPLPPALLLWTGPLATLVWLAVALCMFSSRSWRIAEVRRPELVAGGVAVLLGAFTFSQVSSLVPAGDEPHYLVITQSLLKDGDLRIENNHRQRDYRAYIDGDIPPDFRVRGRDREIYSIHAPGVPALVVPAFAIGGYRGVVAFLLLLSGITAGLAWHLAWLITRRYDAAWFGWASVVLSTTFLFHSFAVYPDGPGALAVLTGVWALVRTERTPAARSESVVPWLLCGAALATLPWMHTRFVVLAAGLGALILLRLGAAPNAVVKAGALLAVPIVSAVCWIGYFVRIYGTPDPAAPYGGEPGSFAFVPDGLAGLLFDQRFGLFAYAPVLLFAFGGVGVMLARREFRRQALELLFVVLPYLLLVTYVAMWWGGASAPARFFTPVLPWMAVPAAIAWTVLSRTGRATALAALVFTVFASAALVVVDDGRLAFNIRETYARWLEWLNGSLDLARGFPVWWRDNETPLFRGILIWGAVAAAGWFAIRRLERTPALSSPPRFRTAVAAVWAVAAAVALSITWAFERVDGRASSPGQLQALRRLSTEPRVLALDLSRPAVEPPEAVPARFRITPPFSSSPGGAGRNDRPLFAVPAVPAGEYRLRFDPRATEGWLMIGIGRDQFALRTEPLAALAREPITLTFPVDVRAIMVRSDEDARRNVARLTIEPVRIVPRSARLTEDYARRAVRYGSSTVYFLDERSFPEPGGFWIGGGRSAAFVLQPDAPASAMHFQLRNGAADNQVVIQAGAWRDTRRLSPGEELTLEVPLDSARGATLLQVTASAGFRPSDIDPQSRDERFLGVWLKVVN